MILYFRKAFSSILSLEFYVIFVLVAFSILSIGSDLLYVTIAVGLSFWLIRWFVNGYPSIRTPVDIGIILLVLMTYLSLLFSPKSIVTFDQVFRLWTGIILFYAAVNWTTGMPRLRILVIIIILTSLLLAVMALLGVDWSFDKLPIIPSVIYEYLPASFGSIFHRNVWAGYLVYLLPPTIGVLFFAWNEINYWGRISLIMAAVIVSTVLILTQSRGALLAFGAIIALLFLFRWRKAWFLVPVGVIGVVLIYYFSFERLLNIVASGVSLGGLEGRLEVWSRATYIIHDFPVLGVGMGLFEPVVDTMYPFFVQEPGSVPHAHNLLLQIAVDLGIPGLVGWFSIFLGILFAAWQLYQQARPSGNMWVAGLGVGLLLSQTALLIHGLFDSVTWGLLRLSPIVWLVWGSVIASLFVFNKDHQKVLSISKGLQSDHI